MTMTTPAHPTVTVQIPLEVVDELYAVQDFLEERLIGRVPNHLQSLVFAVQDADTRAIDTDDDGEPFTFDTADEARLEADAAEAELQANEAARRERDDWERAQHARVEREYNAWLNEYAEKFDQARGAWWRNRTEQLHGEYDARTSGPAPDGDRNHDK